MKKTNKFKLLLLLPFLALVGCNSTDGSSASSSSNNDSTQDSSSKEDITSSENNDSTNESSKDSETSSKEDISSETSSETSSQTSSSETSSSETSSSQDESSHDENEVVFNDANPNAKAVSVKTLYDKRNEDHKLYRLSGYINSISDDRYGSFDLTDDTGSICVYGCRKNKNCISESNGEYSFTSDKEWHSLGLHVGDYITIEGVHKIYSVKKGWSYSEFQGYAVKAIKRDVWKIPEVSYTAKDNYTGTYYDDLENLTGSDFKLGLHNLLNETHTGWLNYNSLDNKLTQTDVRDGSVRCFYSNQSIGRNFNKEHVWPQSRSNNVFTTSGAGSDIHHIRATLSQNNSKRGNSKFGYVFNKVGANTLAYNGGGCTYYTAERTSTGTWEPADSIKGDCARIIAYVYIHYNDFGTNSDKNYANIGHLYLNNVIGSDRTMMTNLLRKWNAEDPVDEVEINRNNIGYKLQGNRNPFIDHPSYMDKIDFGTY